MSKPEEMAATAWKNAQLSGTSQEGYYIQYTDISALNDEEIPEGITRKLPRQGICIVMYGPDGMVHFEGMHMTCLNQSGDIIYDFDYTAEYDTYEKIMPATYTLYNMDKLEKATAKLNECNWVSGVALYAYDQAKAVKEVPSAPAENKWYSFRESQRQKICK